MYQSSGDTTSHYVDHLSAINWTEIRWENSWFYSIDICPLLIDWHFGLTFYVSKLSYLKTSRLHKCLTQLQKPFPGNKAHEADQTQSQPVQQGGEFAKWRWEGLAACRLAIMKYPCSNPPMEEWPPRGQSSPISLSSQGELCPATTSLVPGLRKIPCWSKRWSWSSTFRGKGRELEAWEMGIYCLSCL